MKNKITLIAALAGFLACGSAGAATISFSSVTPISGDSNILATTGSQTVLDAYYFTSTPPDAPTTSTVNGVLFTAVNQSVSTAGDVSFNPNPATQGTLPADYWSAAAGHGSGGPSSGDLLNLSSGYQNILANYLHNPAGLDITFSNLVVGQTYMAEFFTTQSNGNSASKGWDVITSDGISSGDVRRVYNDTGLGTGSYVTATFVASDTTQDFTIEGFLSNGNIDPAGGQLNALELVEAVPEPSTVALMAGAIGLLGLGAVRRFRLAGV